MRKKVIPLFFILLMLPAEVLIAQQVRISGHLNGMNSQALVRVIVYADPFSKLEKTVAKTHPDASGNFSFVFPLKQTTYAMLAINLWRKPFYLKPGASYHFEISKDTTTGATRFWGFPLQFQMKAEDDSLNARLEIYDAMYSRLINRDFRNIFLYHQQQPVRDFEQKAHRRFSGIRDAYVQNYIRYSLAFLHWGARMEPLPQAVLHDFADHPVLYHNRQYGRYFLDFFRAYFKSTVNRPVTLDKLSQIVPLRKLKKLDSLFAQAPALGKDLRVRQLAEMVQLADLYFRPDFDRNDIEALFRQMARNSPYPENRQVAENYMRKLRILQPGTPAPDFLLPDLYGKEVSLSRFKGKFVLLGFIHTGCPVCNYQMKQLEKLQNNLTDFTNLTIVSGKITSRFMKDVNPTGKSWPFLLLGNDLLLLEKYQVVSYPAYVFIDPAGNILMAPAPMPDENLQQLIEAFIKAFKKKHKIE
jgi:thioredoxin-related protein